MPATVYSAPGSTALNLQAHWLQLPCSQGAGLSVAEGGIKLQEELFRHAYLHRMLLLFCSGCCEDGRAARSGDELDAQSGKLAPVHVDFPRGWGLQEEVLGGLLDQHYACTPQGGGKQVYAQNDTGMHRGQRYIWYLTISEMSLFGSTLTEVRLVDWRRMHVLRPCAGCRSVCPAGMW